jgi:hypothetical protein
MDLSLPEFKYEYVFTKFKKNEDSITIPECKLAFIYLFGKIIKKKEIKKHFYEEKTALVLNEFVYLCNIIKTEYNVTSATVLNEFYQLLITSDGSIIPINSFKLKIKKYFPNLSNNFIEECYNQLNSNGKLKIYDLEKYLINI